MSINIDRTLLLKRYTEQQDIHPSKIYKMIARLAALDTLDEIPGKMYTETAACHAIPCPVPNTNFLI